MWAIAGVLLGLVAVTGFAGFHIGPHAHAASSVFGTLAAVFLVILAFTGHADALLFGLLAGDVVVTGGMAAIAAKGLSERELLTTLPTDGVVGTFGTAIDDLDPLGTVRVQGEVWSATALNPPIAAGAVIHVIRQDSVRLEVWGDSGAQPDELFSIDAIDTTTGAGDDHDPNTLPDRAKTAQRGDERTPLT